MLKRIYPGEGQSPVGEAASNWIVCACLSRVSRVAGDLSVHSYLSQRSSCVRSLRAPFAASFDTACARSPPTSSTMERFDYSPTYHIFCYLLTVESFLLFAAIAQTKSHFVGAHGPLARAFGLVFLFQSLGALFTALAIEFEPWAADFVLHVVRFLAKFSIGAAIAAAVPAASAIAFPEMGNALKKFGMSLLATVIIIYTAYLSAEVSAEVFWSVSLTRGFRLRCSWV